MVSKPLTVLIFPEITLSFSHPEPSPRNPSVMMMSCQPLSFAAPKPRWLGTRGECRLKGPTDAFAAPGYEGASAVKRTQAVRERSARAVRTHSRFPHQAPKPDLCYRTPSLLRRILRRPSRRCLRRRRHSGAWGSHVASRGARADVRSRSCAGSGCG